MKPILFNTEMVRAILNGRKTATRRLIKPHYKEDEGGFQVCTNKKTGERWVEKSDWDEGSFDPPRYITPLYMPGDILYVREAWAYVSDWINLYPDVKIFDGYVYKADWYIYKADWKEKEHPKWRPSIHMPKEAARIFLRVTDVRAQRLQSMTEDDVCDEGAEKIISWCEHIDYSVVPPEPWYNTRQCKDCIIFYSYPELFGKMVWNPTIKKKNLPLYGWEANPWVWVIEFEQCKDSELYKEDNDAKVH